MQSSSRSGIATRSTSSSTWSLTRIGPSLLLVFIATVTAFHWLVLIFQLRFFVNIPAWYWKFDPVPFGVGDLWYVLGALIFLALAYWALIVKQRLALGLMCVFVLGWFLQVGVGLMGGAGFGTLRERYFTTYHQAYVARAAESKHTVLESIRQYDSIYGSNTFTTTKPPGLMAFYIGLEHVVNGYPSILDSAARYARLSAVITWLFPLLAASMLVLLWAFAGRFMQDLSGLVARMAPFLYVLAPSVALFTFFADQAIYPAVFLLGTWFAVSVIRRASLPWSVLLGAVLYVAAFFTFAALPLYPFAGLYLLLHNWKEQSAGRIQRVLLTGLGIAAGTIITYFLGRTLLNYDFVSHFQRMASINHNFDFYLRVGQQPPGGPEPLAVRLVQIARAAWLNNLDFAAAIGFPIYILFAVQATAPHSEAWANPAFLPVTSSCSRCSQASWCSTWPGQPRAKCRACGCSGCRWSCCLQPSSSGRTCARRPRLLLLLGGAQIITLMLTFHFQDLRM